MGAMVIMIRRNECEEGRKVPAHSKYIHILKAARRVSDMTDCASMFPAVAELCLFLDAECSGRAGI